MLFFTNENKKSLINRLSVSVVNRFFPKQNSLFIHFSYGIRDLICTQSSQKSLKLKSKVFNKLFIQKLNWIYFLLNPMIQMLETKSFLKCRTNQSEDYFWNFFVNPSVWVKQNSYHLWYFLSITQRLTKSLSENLWMQSIHKTTEDWRNWSR